MEHHEEGLAPGDAGHRGVVDFGGTVGCVSEVCRMEQVDISKCKGQGQAKFFSWHIYP